MSRRLSLVLLSGASAADSTGIGVANDADVANCSEFSVYTEFDHTSAAGVISIETAPRFDYAGTWAVLGTVTWAAIDRVHYTAITGILGALRARITTAVTSGTVKVTAFGNVT